MNYKCKNQDRCSSCPFQYCIDGVDMDEALMVKAEYRQRRDLESLNANIIKMPRRTDEEKRLYNRQKQREWYQRNHEYKNMICRERYQRKAVGNG